jgi:hypothetical protein
MSMRDQIADIIDKDVRLYRNQSITHFDITDAILSALPDMISPLVWGAMNCGEYKCETRLFCGRIYRNNSGCWTLDDGEGYSPHDTLEAAKAAANAHHRAAFKAILTGETT